MRRQSNPITPHETWLELFWSKFNRSSCVFFWQTLLVTATCTKVLVSVFSPSIWVLYQGWVSLAAMARRNIIDLFWHTLTARDDTRDREANSSRQNDVAGGDFLRGKQVEHATALSLAFAAAKIKNLPLALEKKIGAWLLGKSIDDGARRSNNWLDQWQSDILGTGGRVKSLTRGFFSSTDVPVLLLNKPIIAQWQEPILGSWQWGFSKIFF